MKKDEFNKSLKVFIIIGAIFILCVLMFYLIKFSHLGISNDQAIWAQFGDYFGGVLNPVFAFLAFIALLITIKLQNEALNQSKDELELTRKELEKSAKAQEEQSASLKLQNKATELQIFENTFFKLIELWVNTRTNIKYGKYYGLEAVIQIKANTKDSSDTRFNKYIKPYIEQTLKILQYIENSNIEEKNLYFDIFSSQFSGDELEYIEIYFKESEDKELIEKYLLNA
ncbi:putative phage abortive infection protein [Arcobacter arenosus]|uniref:putative phage abortive infection protein n=1 Tax=Arcobacter arenosus TaxID=2576037 RepID=UPI003BA8ED16